MEDPTFSLHFWDIFGNWQGWKPKDEAKKHSWCCLSVPAPQQSQDPSVSESSSPPPSQHFNSSWEFVSPNTMEVRCEELLRSILKIHFVYMDVFCLHYVCVWCQQRPERASDPLATEVNRQLWAAMQCWEPNPSPLQEQQILLTSEASLPGCLCSFHCSLLPSIILKMAFKILSIIFRNNRTHSALLSLLEILSFKKDKILPGIAVHTCDFSMFCCYVF